MHEFFQSFYLEGVMEWIHQMAPHTRFSNSCFS